MLTKVANKRVLPGAARLTMMTFPKDPSEFIRLFPHVYTESDPPCTSRIDEVRIRKMCRADTMPARSSNKFMERKAATPVETGSSSEPFATALQYIMGGGAVPQMARRALPALANYAHETANRRVEDHPALMNEPWGRG